MDEVRITREVGEKLLKCALTDKERLTVGQELADADQSLAEAESELASIKAEKHTLSEQVQRTKSWAGVIGAVQDPGTSAAPEQPRTAAGLRAQWAADAELRQAFALGGIASWVEHLRLEGQLSEAEAAAVRAELAA
jgi:hypothetical protein